MDERGAWACIKPMPGRTKLPAFSPFLYRYRNLVERFFNKLKHFRAVATRFEKTPKTTSPSSSSPPSEYGCALIVGVLVQLARCASCPSHSTGNPFISAGSVTPSACRPSMIASTISGASSVSRSTRQR